MQPFVIDRKIDFKDVRLVDASGNFHKSIFVGTARDMAKYVNLDLVCFNNPEKEQLALCKIIDYGKWKYHNDKILKKEKLQKISSKEVHFSPVIDDHDAEHKVKRIKEFLQEGHEVILIMRFKGIQKRHFSIGSDRMNEIVAMCSEYGEVVNDKKMDNQIIVHFKKK